MAATFDIAVVGAGFSGVALVAALQRPAYGGRIALIGTPAEFGSGYPYSTGAGNYLLNSRADRMGLHADNPGGFADWLGLQGAARAGFAPRSVYGAYLQAQLQRLRADLGQHLHCIPARVVAATRERGWLLTLGDGARIGCKRLVLACGPLPSVAPIGVDASALAHRRYIRDPLRADALDRLPKRSRLVVLGSGLTMVDSVLGLLDRGHAGPLLAVSRHGLLPLPHVLGHSIACDFQLPRRRYSTLSVLRALRQAASAGGDWRSLMDGLRDELPDLWRAASMRDRSRFLRHLAPIWSIHRHRLPQRNWQRLQEAIEAGQLEVRAARVLRVSAGPRGLQAILRPRGESTEQKVVCSAVLQATGFSGRIAHSGNPLLASLHQAGWLASDPFGLGIATRRGGSVRSPSGKTAPGLFALGALARAEAWDATAAPELRIAATQLAERLANTAKAATSVVSLSTINE
ncbi:MAG: FAD/NAD(P)-binding protein [Pseudomarimonas sp.]